MVVDRHSVHGQAEVKGEGQCGGRQSCENPAVDLTLGRNMGSKDPEKKQEGQGGENKVYHRVAKVEWILIGFSHGQEREPFQEICPLKIEPLQNLVEIARHFIVVGSQSAFRVVPGDQQDAPHPHGLCYLQIVKGIADIENLFLFQVIIPYPPVPEVKFPIGVMMVQTENGFKEGGYAVLAKIGEERLYIGRRQHTLSNSVALKYLQGFFGSGMEFQGPTLAFVGADKLFGKGLEAVLFQVETQFAVVIDDGEIEGFPVLPDRDPGKVTLIKYSVDHVDAQLDVVYQGSVPIPDDVFDGVEGLHGQSMPITGISGNIG